MGTEGSNLDFFPSVSSTRAIAFCRAGLFKEKSLLSFCPFHSSPNYLFSWELTSFAAVQSVPVSFPSDSGFDVLLSGSAGAAELLCPHWEGLCGIRDPRTDYSCWNIFTRVELL